MSKEPRILSKEYHLYINNSPYPEYITTDYGLIPDYIDRLDREEYPDGTTLYKLQTVVHYAPAVEQGWVVKRKDLHREKSLMETLQDGIELLGYKDAPLDERRVFNRTLLAIQGDIRSKIKSRRGYL